MKFILFLMGGVIAGHVTIGETCQVDLGCETKYEFCKPSETQVAFSSEGDYAQMGVCMHKEPFPMFGMEFAGCFAMIFVLFASNCGGLGGGGAVIPLAMFFFSFDARNAIALSNATIVVAALIRYVINFRQPHPLKLDTNGDKTGILVDHNIPTLMMPMIVVGAAVGATLNLIMPEPVIAVGIFLVLSFVSVTTTIKWWTIRQAEKHNKVDNKSEV